MLYNTEAHTLILGLVKVEGGVSHYKYNPVFSEG